MATKKDHKKKKVAKKSNFQKQLFVDETEQFVKEIESLSKALDITIKTLDETSIKSMEKVTKFLQGKKVVKNPQKNKLIIYVMPGDLSVFKKYTKDVISSSLAIKNIPRIFFCSLVHHYDAYLGHLLRSAFYSKPELLNASQKTIIFKDLIGHSSINTVKETIIEKEIESVIRESHVKQFEWMESRFGMPLKKDLLVWPAFVELTERRNLFVHSGGVVSSQYLSVCKENGVILDGCIKKGCELHVSQEYFKKSFECIFEIGIKLGQVIWRKLVPEELKKADEVLHYITYDLLEQERYSLAKTLLEFATEILKRSSSDNIRRMNRINLAIAYKFSGDRASCQKVLTADDWSACGNEFRLAVAVLQEKYDDAIKLMRKIGTKGDVTRSDYTEWPLFKEFRKTKEFLKTYQKLFGEEFILRGDPLVAEQIKKPFRKKIMTKK
jgi:hypothetical protein